ncbi:hypothetical protein [Stenotrophomonas acidaminiphila]
MKVRKHIVMELSLIEALEEQMTKKGKNFSDLISEMLEMQVDGLDVKNATANLTKKFENLEKTVTEQLIDMRMQSIAINKMNEDEIKKQIQFAVEEIKSDTQVAKQAIYDDLKDENNQTVERMRMMSSRLYELVMDGVKKQLADDRKKRGLKETEEETVEKPVAQRGSGAFGGNGVLSVSNNK